MVIFATLQIAVLQFVEHKSRFEHYITQMDNKIIEWLMNLENSNLKIEMPAYLYESISESLSVSFRSDFNNIVEEYDFYG